VRNELIFEGKKSQPQGVISRVLSLLETTRRQEMAFSTSRRPKEIHIQVPMNAWCVLIDASWQPNQIAIFDPGGIMKQAFTEQTRAMDPFHAEAQAMLHVLQILHQGVISGQSNKIQVMTF
jgi:hypothetical protein